MSVDENIALQQLRRIAGRVFKKWDVSTIPIGIVDTDAFSGKYYPDEKDRRIEISSAVIQGCERKRVIILLIHELSHYVCHIKYGQLMGHRPHWNQVHYMMSTMFREEVDGYQTIKPQIKEE